jgi:RNA polymerase sigma factor (sigma-70 family)
MGERGPRPTDALPHVLVRLFDANDQATHDAAWSAFVAEYSGLLLQVARSSTSGHDSAMDAYAFVLDQLHENNGNRLRTFDARSGARFSTWLLVVARRLCIDFRRRRYGRRQASSGEPQDQSTVDRATRRRLVDLAAEEIDIESLSDADGDSPDARLRLAELLATLSDALDALDPADRLLLVMRFNDNRSASVIATALGFPTQFHVYRRLTHVLARLRAALEKRGVDDPLP